MADVVFHTVFGHLLIAEAELKQKDLDQANVKAAFDELVSLSRRVADHHLASDRRTRYHYVVGEYYPLIQRTTERWYKTLPQDEFQMGCSSSLSSHFKRQSL